LSIKSLLIIINDLPRFIFILQSLLEQIKNIKYAVVLLAGDPSSFPSAIYLWPIFLGSAFLHSKKKPQHVKKAWVSVHSRKFVVGAHVLQSPFWSSALWSALVATSMTLEYTATHSII
jgi:hypothetical protein